MRNTLMFYIEKLWGASHDFWGSLWLTLYGLAGNNDLIVHIVGSNIVHLVVFVVFNALFMVCDVWGIPGWLQKYKVQEDKNVPVDRSKLWRCVKRVTFNMCVVGPIFTAVMYPLTLLNGAYHKGELPTFNRVLIEFVVFALIEEIGFYYSHRILHLPQFYAKHHKLHHEWTAPIGIVSIYCGTLEMISSNLLPAFMGPFLMQSHLLTTWLWFSLVVFSTTIAHGGYHVPFFSSPEAHDFHHKSFNCWFGTLGILDRLHKTDKPFVDSIHFERHFISTSLTPVNTLIPAPVKPSKCE